jgi:hypothetical protein
MTAARVTPGAIFFQQFQPFRAQAVLELQKPGHVSTGLRQTVHETGSDRVKHIVEHDRNGSCRPQQRRHPRTAGRDENVGSESDQFLRMALAFGRIATGPSHFEVKVSTLDPPDAAKLLHKLPEAGLQVGVVGSQIVEHADAPHPLTLLRARRARPRCRRTSEQLDELAPFH